MGALPTFNANLEFAENDSLRASLKDAADATCALEATLRERDAALHRKSSAAERAAMNGAAEMEQQVDRYKQMVQDLAASSQMLSKDNVILSEEVAQLRRKCSDEQEQGCALEERVGKLQVTSHTSMSLLVCIAYRVCTW